MATEIVVQLCKIAAILQGFQFPKNKRTDKLLQIIRGENNMPYDLELPDTDEEKNATDRLDLDSSIWQVRQRAELNRD